MIKGAEVTKIIQINLYCDKCGKRMKRREGGVLTTYPLKFVYECECGEVQTSTEVYPSQKVYFDEENAKEMDFSEVKKDD